MENTWWLSRIKLKGYSPERTFFFCFFTLSSLKALNEHGKMITNVRIETVTERITTPDKGAFFSNFERAYTVSIALFVLWLENTRAGVFKRNFRYFAAFLRNDILLKGAKAKHVI